MKQRLRNFASITFLSIAGVGFFSGCQSANHYVPPSSQSATMLNQEAFYRKAQENEYSTDPILSKHVSGRFMGTPVYRAVKNACRKLGVNFDSTFIPSNEYTISSSFSGTFGDFLDMVFRQSGVRYSHVDGIIKVTNRQLVNQQEASHGKDGKPFSVSLIDVPAVQVFKYFSDNYGYSFDFRTKFFNISGKDKNKQALPHVSFFYKGRNVEEAIYRFAKSNDLKLKQRGKKFEVYDYDTLSINMPLYFDTDFTSSESSIASSSSVGASNSGSSSGLNGSNGGTQLRFKENYKKNVTKYISHHLTKGIGTVDVSSKGYVVVVDRPSVVSEIRKLIQRDVNSQTVIDLDVSIVRIDVNDESGMGVDWSVILKELGDSLNLRRMTMNLNYSDMVSSGFSISGFANGKKQLLNILDKYGRSKVVREFHARSRSGFMHNFRATEEIPYVTTSVVQSTTGATVAGEARVATVGLIINILPTLNDNGYVTLSTDIEVSEYLGDKHFNVGGSEYILPKIAKNKIQAPTTVRLDDTIVLTGLKLREDSKSTEGIPLLSRINHVGGLFGANTKGGKSSEFVIVITPKRVRSM